ncbi:MULTISPECIES: hypothetical protein [Methylotenera]|uniref:hypothetical protein n=1 Tax=Methylotenera TaxID=359407 RepID=UPI000362AD47|nr:MULTISPECIES: hypothetical protein [Methylotenera]
MQKHRTLNYAGVTPLRVHERCEVFENFTEQEFAFFCFDGLLSERDNNSVKNFTHQFLSRCDKIIHLLENQRAEQNRLNGVTVSTFTTLDQYLYIIQDLHQILSQITNSRQLKKVLPELKIESLRAMVIVENINFNKYSSKFSPLLPYLESAHKTSTAVKLNAKKQSENAICRARIIVDKYYECLKECHTQVKTLKKTTQYFDKNNVIDKDLKKITAKESTIRRSFERLNIKIPVKSGD